MSTVPGGADCVGGARRAAHLGSSEHSLSVALAPRRLRKTIRLLGDPAHLLHGRLPRPCLSLCTAHGPQPTVSSRVACAERRRSRKSAHAIMTEAREPHVEWVDGFLSHAGQSERERKPRRRRRSGMDSREPGPWALGALSLTELSRSRGQRPKGLSWTRSHSQGDTARHEAALGGAMTKFDSGLPQTHVTEAEASQKKA